MTLDNQLGQPGQSDLVQENKVGTPGKFFVGETGDNMQRVLYPDLKLRPPTYSGKKSERIRQFFSKFEKLMVHHRVAQNERVRYLGLMIEGDALEYFDNLLARENDREYAEVKASLISRFDDERIKLVIRSKLNNRRLQTEESVTDFYSELEARK